MIPNIYYIMKINTITTKPFQLFFLVFISLPTLLVTLTGQEITFPSDLKTIIDVTRPPYNCDNTGNIDCTEALIRAMDDLVRDARDGQKALEKEIFSLELENYLHPSSVENRIRDGKKQVIFPAELRPARILYFPKGVYKVSNTVCYTFDDLENSIGNELNRQIVMVGQSKDETIIKLQDNCPGFEAGANKPVISYMKKEKSNVAMANIFENLTIDIGKGNPGASGLRFFANNMGAVRNVTIKSSDPEKRGATGLLIDKYNLSGILVKNLEVDGFDYGIQANTLRIYSVYEHIKLSNQHVCGFLINKLIVSIRKLESNNSVPAIRITGPSATVVIIDSELNRIENNNCQGANSAIEFENGELFARNVKIKEYDLSVTQYGKSMTAPGNIEEYNSGKLITLFDQQDNRSLNLPVEETPEINWDNDESKWIGVHEFGAKGDGKTDDSNAIQKALESGKPNIYFQPGKYLINKQISVPASVKRINFMYCNLAAGEMLREKVDEGTFVVREFADNPLVIEDLFAFEDFKGPHYFVEHASKRTLVLSDIHIQLTAVYTNSVPGGKVFIENICCTDPHQPNQNCYHFKGQQVWARQLNPERADPEVLNDGSTFWVLGTKMEGGGVGVLTKNNGYSEILGGTTNGTGKEAVVNDNSTVSCVLGSTNWKQINRPVITEIKGDVEKSIMKFSLPVRVQLDPSGSASNDQFFIPLYVGKK